ncbi:MAG: fused MFS/spermidine synthase [Magnetococcus sp. YQC-3]
MLHKWLSLLLVGLLPLSAAAGEIHQEKSLYRNILVYEEQGVRCMKFGVHDSGRQTCVSLDNPDALVFEYTKMLLGALYLKPAPKTVLVIGLGGGTIPATLQKIRPDIQIDCVEIDPAVVRVAKKYFNFSGEGMNLFVEDGRVFVKHLLRQKRKYDLVILDAFDHISVPEHMTTKEFLQEVRGILQPDGVLAANTFSMGKFYPSESATYSAVFGTYFNLRRNNRIVLLKNDGLPGMEEIKRNAEGVEKQLQRFATSKEWLLPLFSTEVQWPEGTRVLTDQYSPSNLLNSAESL